MKTPRLYEDYPDSILFHGTVYALDLDVHTVLRVLDMDRAEWTEQERVELSLHLLLKDPAQMPQGEPERAALLWAILNALTPDGAEESSGDRYLDFAQDAGKIYTAFLRIGIDLTRERLHFCRFLDLLADLPGDTALMRTIEIRRKPLPKYNGKNGEEIAALQRAKARVALQMDESERRARFAASLKKTAF